MRADSGTVVGTEEESDARGNLLREAIGKGHVEITMPRGFDHGSLARRSMGSPKQDLT